MNAQTKTILSKYYLAFRLANGKTEKLKMSVLENNMVKISEIGDSDIYDLPTIVKMTAILNKRYALTTGGKG